MPDDKVIDVPGHGQVAFPADMSDEDIERAIRKDYLSRAIYGQAMRPGTYVPYEKKARFAYTGPGATPPGLETPTDKQMLSLLPAAGAVGASLLAGPGAGLMTRAGLATLGGMIGSGAEQRAQGQNISAVTSGIQGTIQGAVPEFLGGAIFGGARLFTGKAPAKLMAKPAGELLEAALKPSAKAGVAQSFERSIPLLKDAADAAGITVGRIEDVPALALTKKLELWGQYASSLTKAGKQIPSVDPIDFALRAIKLVPKDTIRLHPEIADRIVNELSKIQGIQQGISVPDMELVRKGMSSNLDVFFSKFPRARYIQGMTNPDTAAQLALRQAASDSIEDTIGSISSTELRKDYGALTAVQNAAERRLEQVSAGQGGAGGFSLLAKAYAIGRVGRGVARGIAGDPWAVADVAQGATHLGAISYDAALRNADNLFHAALFGSPGTGVQKGVINLMRALLGTLEAPSGATLGDRMKAKAQQPLNPADFK